jgi:dTDP-glucose 4,6-dehydratase
VSASALPAASLLRGATVVVTGGAGFLGSHLCERGVAAGARVICVDDESTGAVANVAALLPEAGFELVDADISERLPAPERVDVVFHLASTASPVHYLERPVDTLRSGSLGTLNALDLAHRADARLVLASTSEVYGDPAVHPQHEGYWGNVNPVGPRSCYDESKRFAEAAVTAYRSERGVDTGIARIFNTYGPRMRVDDGRVVPAFIDQALRGEPLTVAGDGRQTRSLCYVADTVDALLRLAACRTPGPVNVGNPSEISVLELAQRVLRATGSASTVRHTPLPADDPQRRRPAIGLAARDLDWSPRTGLDDGLSETVAWFRARVADQTRAVPAT